MGTTQRIGFVGKKFAAQTSNKGKGTIVVPVGPFTKYNVSIDTFLNNAFDPLLNLRPLQLLNSIDDHTIFWEGLSQYKAFLSPLMSSPAFLVQILLILLYPTLQPSFPSIAWYVRFSNLSILLKVVCQSTIRILVI